MFRPLSSRKRRRSSGERRSCAAFTTATASVHSIRIIYIYINYDGVVGGGGGGDAIDECREQTLAAEADESSQGSESKAKKPKTPEMIEKIVQGKVNKRLNEMCLLGQVQLQTQILYPSFASFEASNHPN